MPSSGAVAQWRWVALKSKGARQDVRRGRGRLTGLLPPNGQVDATWDQGPLGKCPGVRLLRRAGGEGRQATEHDARGDGSGARMEAGHVAVQPTEAASLGFAVRPDQCPRLAHAVVPGQGPIPALACGTALIGGVYLDERVSE